MYSTQRVRLLPFRVLEETYVYCTAKSVPTIQREAGGHRVEVVRLQIDILSFLLDLYTVQFWVSIVEIQTHNLFIS